MNYFLGFLAIAIGIALFGFWVRSLDKTWNLSREERREYLELEKRISEFKEPLSPKENDRYLWLDWKKDHS